jgi:hypothetical protein
MAFLAIGAASSSADPATSVAVKDVASVRWDGAASNAKLGETGLSNAGDVNGDGRNDVIATAANSANRGVYVFFTPKSLNGVEEAGSSLDPQNGYLMNGSGFTPSAAMQIGDQNGDDVPDFLLTDGAAGRAYVVYGLSDPTSLPLCGVAPATTRCLDVTTLTASQGYTVESGQSGDSFGAAAVNAGFVNDDDIIDFGIGAPTSSFAGNNSGSAYVVYGGRSAAPVDLSALPATEVVRIDGPEEMASFGAFTGGTDIDGDGQTDLSIAMLGAGITPATTYEIYASALTTSPISLATFTADQGFRIRPTVLTPAQTVDAGDINDDGLNDIGVGMVGLLGASGTGAIIFNPGGGEFVDPISAMALDPAEGYVINEGDSGSRLGSSLANIGDLNGDGVPDQAFGARTTPANGFSGAGSADILFGQRPTPEGPLELGANYSPDLGIALTGSNANANTGQFVVNAGDVDRDGLTDMFVSAPRAKENTINNSGSVYLVLGSSLLGQAKTGLAGSITQNGAVLGGVALANGHTGSTYFQYGETDAYGSETSAVTLDGSDAPESTDTEVSGLAADTEYHYRLVVENDLGLKAYGQDRTFKTRAEPVDPCEPDNTQPGCPGFNGEEFCKANPNDEVCQKGSDPEKFCEANPTAGICKSPIAGLSDLIANSNVAKVRRGKKAVVWTWITSTGTKSADGVKVCASVPKNKAKVVGKRCRTIASLAPGKTAKVKFRVKAKARKGAKVNIKLVASTEGVGKKTAKVRLTVR